MNLSITEEIYTYFSWEHKLKANPNWSLAPTNYRELGIGIVTYCPLGRGFLSGKAVTESIPANSLLVYMDLNPIPFCFWW